MRICATLIIFLAAFDLCGTLPAPPQTTPGQVQPSDIAVDKAQFINLHGIGSMDGVGDDAGIDALNSIIVGGVSTIEDDAALLGDLSLFGAVKKYYHSTKKYAAAAETPVEAAAIITLTPIPTHAAGVIWGLGRIIFNIGGWIWKNALKPYLPRPEEDSKAELVGLVRPDDRIAILYDPRRNTHVDKRDPGADTMVAAAITAQDTIHRYRENMDAKLRAAFDTGSKRKNVVVWAIVTDYQKDVQDYMVKMGARGQPRGTRYEVDAVLLRIEEGKDTLRGLIDDGILDKTKVMETVDSLEPELAVMKQHLQDHFRWADQDVEFAESSTNPDASARGDLASLFM